MGQDHGRRPYGHDHDAAPASGGGGANPSPVWTADENTSYTIIIGGELQVSVPQLAQSRLSQTLEDWWWSPQDVSVVLQRIVASCRIVACIPSRKSRGEQWDRSGLNFTDFLSKNVLHQSCQTA